MPLFVTYVTCRLSGTTIHTYSPFSVVTDGEGKDAHTKIEFKLSASGATGDMLSIATDGLKMSDTWDCGTF